jgi:hypothetical protein
VNTVHVVELVLKYHQDRIHDLSIALEWHCPCTAGIQQCMCMVGTKKCDGSSQKFMLQMLFHFFSHLKGEQMGSLNLWWRETWVHYFTENEL